MSIDNPFEQYRLIVEETARIRDARHNISNIFLSVNGILISATALILQQSAQTIGTHPLPLFILLIPLLLVIGGFTLCFFWMQLLRNYSNLLGFRFEYLRNIESDYQNRLIPFFTDQTAHLRKNRIPGFTAVESRMPLVFMALYLCIISGMIVFGLIVSNAIFSLIPILPR